MSSRQTDGATVKGGSRQAREICADAAQPETAEAAVLKTLILNVRALASAGSPEIRQAAEAWERLLQGAAEAAPSRPLAVLSSPKLDEPALKMLRWYARHFCCQPGDALSGLVFWLIWQMRNELRELKGLGIIAGWNDGPDAEVIEARKRRRKLENEREDTALRLSQGR